MKTKILGVVLSILLLTPTYADRTLDLPIQRPVYHEPGTEEPEKEWWELNPPPEQPTDEMPEPPPESIELFGQEITLIPNGTIVFVIDVSSSMLGLWRGEQTRWDKVLQEAQEAISGLDESFRFSVVAFDSGVWQWSNELLPATEKYKDMANRWLAERKPLSSTATGPAVIQALQYNPNQIVLMTDGIPNVPWSSAERHRQEILKANFSRIKIDVFGIALNQNGSKAINYVAKEFCRRVSSDTGGTFFDLH